MKKYIQLTLCLLTSIVAAETIDFEEGTLPADFSFSSNGNWYVQSLSAYEGDYALQTPSGLADYEEAVLELAGDFPEGTVVKFQLKMSSQTYNSLIFYTGDDEWEGFYASGIYEWKEFSYTLDEASESLKWKYRAGWSSQSSDAAWLDNIEIIIDSDADGLPDDWEEQYFSSLEYGAFDDFDDDGFNHMEEQAAGLSPLYQDIGMYYSKGEGLNLLNDISNSSSLTPGLISLASKCFESHVITFPGDYEARIFASLTRLANLMNQQDLHELLNMFGYTFSELVNDASGDFSAENAPDMNWAVDQAGTNVSAALDASLADLNAIPSDWSGTVEISPSELSALSEPIYLDAADVTFIRAFIQSLKALWHTEQAHDWEMDYSTLNHQADAPTQAMIIDGDLSDWDGISPQLTSESEDDLGMQVKLAQDAENIFVLIEYDKEGRFYWGSADLKLGDLTELNLQFQGWDDRIDATFYEDDDLHSQTSTSFVTNSSAIELSIAIPTNLPVSYVQIDELYLSIENNYNYYDSNLYYSRNAPAELLLASQPELFSSMRLTNLLAEAKTEWQAALDTFLSANTLALARTDTLMHGIEYDPAYSTNRTEVITRIEEVRASLDAPVNILATNATGETAFEQRVHLGAYFEPAYVTRELLPEFKYILGQPLLSTLPDPSLGGIFPDMSQLDAMSLGRAIYADQDDDGIPDAWEDQIVNADALDHINDVFDVLPEDDFDGDGYSNIEEYTLNRTPLFIDPSRCYVDANSASPEYPYNSLATAATDIQSAIDAVLQNGEVMVASGTYTITSAINITNDVQISSLAGATSTIIDAAGQSRCFLVENATASIKGFTIKNGTAPDYNSGGGLYSSYNATSLVYNCIFEGNYASYGGGMYNGIANNCVFTGNSAEWGGGMYSGTANNCTFTQNSATYGGGKYSGTANNSIAWGNTTTSSYGTDFYSISANNSCWPDANTSSYPDCIASNPMFTDSASGDLRLQESSPCIDIGDNSLTQGSSDLDGNFRIANSTVDMGAYEWNSTPNDDQDEDGLTDEWEWFHFGSLDQSGEDDIDNDELSNAAELLAGSNPVLWDTDHDGFHDGFEVSQSLDPTVRNTELETYIQTYGDMFNLYPSNTVLDVSVGQMLLQQADGTLRLSLQPLQSSDLKTWQNAGEPVEWTVETEGDQQYFRIQAQP